MKDEPTDPMKRRKHILLIAAALLVVIPLALLLRKPAPLDLSNDEEPFKSMVLPPRSVRGGLVADHDSALVYVTDKKGVEFCISFPIDCDRILNAHPTAAFDNFRKLIPLRDPARAKWIAIRLLEDYGNESNPGVKRAREALSEPIGDIAERLYWKTKVMLN